MQMKDKWAYNKDATLVSHKLFRLVSQPGIISNAVQNLIKCNDRRISIFPVSCFLVNPRNGFCVFFYNSLESLTMNVNFVHRRHKKAQVGMGCSRPGDLIRTENEVKCSVEEVRTLCSLCRLPQIENFPYHLLISRSFIRETVHLKYFAKTCKSFFAKFLNRICPLSQVFIDASN